MDEFIGIRNECAVGTFPDNGRLGGEIYLGSQGIGPLDAENEDQRRLE